MGCLVSPWHCLREGTGLGEEHEEEIRQRQTQRKLLRAARRDMLTSSKVGRGYKGLSIISLSLRMDPMKQNNQGTVSLDVCNLNVPSLPFNF